VTSFEAFGANSGLIEELYQRYLDDPSSVDDDWRTFFGDLAANGAAAPPPAAPPLRHRHRRPRARW
jgi:multifunctional 2-oxoglutarate metabolism enzyme